MISQDEAKADVLRHWRELPPDRCATDFDVGRFAEAIYKKYDFRSRASRYSVIEGWLRNELDSAKGQ